MSAPAIARRPSSIGTANMAGDLRAALDNSVAQDVPGAAEDIEERIEEAERNMAPVPQMTQEAMSEDDEPEDDAKVGQLKETYPDLNRMSYGLKNMHAELFLLTERAGNNPFDMLTEMQESIEAETPGGDRQQSTTAFNTLVALFGAARENEGLRRFAADLFTSLNHYKEDKPKIAVLREEIKILNTLYSEKEEETVLAALRAKQQARQQAVAAKGAAQADKKRKAGEEKDAAKKAKTKASELARK
jgi:hypothetical protein